MELDRFVERVRGDDGAESPREGVALFVDGPNVLRDEFDVEVDDVGEAADAAGP
ncbi:NYN domain-containing protein, partial [Halobium palmae]